MIVSSTAAFAPPSAIQPLYGPIKTFVNRFSDSININYKNKGITSTAVCPGFTVTGFHTASGVQEQMDRVPDFLVFMLKILPHTILSFLGKILAPGRYD